VSFVLGVVCSEDVRDSVYVIAKRYIDFLAFLLIYSRNVIFGYFVCCTVESATHKQKKKGCQILSEAFSIPLTLRSLSFPTVSMI
jgi:hypothetical protein